MKRLFAILTLLLLVALPAHAILPGMTPTPGTPDDPGTGISLAGNAASYGYTGYDTTLTYTPSCTENGFAITYVGTAANTADADPQSFADQSVGADGYCTRIIIVAISGAFSTETVSGVTLNGNAMDHIVTGDDAGEQGYCAIYALEELDGTTANISVDGSDVLANMAVSVYQMTGRSSTTASATVGTTNQSQSESLTIPADGAAIGMMSHISGVGSITNITWTNMTEQDDAAIEAATTRYSSSLNSTAGTATRSYSQSGGFTVGGASLCLAAWDDVDP